MNGNGHTGHNPHSPSSSTSHDANSNPMTPTQSAASKNILSTRFNQDYSCIALGTSGGYRIYSCEPFAKCYDSNEGGMGIVEMLFCTSMVALVGAGEQASFSPRRLRLYNTKINKYICELNFVSTVLNVKLNKHRLVAVLETKIYIFDIHTMKILHTLDTPPNPTGVCALSPSSAHCFMVYPASDATGEVLIYDALNLQVIQAVRAHNSGARVLALNSEGTLLATCSQQGTVIRIFSVPDGQKLFTFRRGTYPAKVNCIAFNANSTLICLSSSDSSTIHVFALTNPDPPSAPSVTSAAVSASSTLALSYLPGVFQDIVAPDRHFAKITLKDHAIASSCGFNGENKVMVVTSNGYLYSYTIPPDGGTCKLESERSLLDTPSEAMGVMFHNSSSTSTTTSTSNTSMYGDDNKDRNYKKRNIPSTRDSEEGPDGSSARILLADDNTSTSTSATTSAPSYASVSTSHKPRTTAPVPKSQPKAHNSPPIKPISKKQ